MKSLQQIADELRKQFGSRASISVDFVAKTIDVCKPNLNLWIQTDFDRLYKVMTENSLIMWMRMEVKTNSNGVGLELVPVFHIHRYKEKED